jgi:hypothetical protein
LHLFSFIFKKTTYFTAFLQKISFSGNPTYVSSQISLNLQQSNFETFLRAVVPFFIVFNEAKKRSNETGKAPISELLDIRPEIIDQISKELGEFSPTLNKLSRTFSNTLEVPIKLFGINKIKPDEAENIMQRLKKNLHSVVEIRNRWFHAKIPRERMYVISAFEKLAELLSEVYEILHRMKMKNLFPRVILIRNFISDRYSCDFIFAEEFLKVGTRNWYIFFEKSIMERLQEEDSLDYTQIHFMLTETNPVAINPFLFPVEYGLGILE